MCLVICYSYPSDSFKKSLNDDGFDNGSLRKEDEQTKRDENTPLLADSRYRDYFDCITRGDVTVASFPGAR